ncbi:MAG: AsmA family protein [Oceanococcus sp.]
MSPFLKKFLLVVVVAVALLAAVLAYIVITVDPNDYKADIQLQVNQQTGRELTLSGPLELSVFPWLGVKANGVSLSNAQGFADTEFASVEHVEVRLRLLPLLKKRIQLGQVTLAGLVLNLERKADGSTNWDDLAQPDESAAQSAEVEESSGEMPDLRVDGLQLSNARIQWRDAGELTVVEGLNISTGPIAEDESSDLAVQVKLSMADQTVLNLDLSSAWQFSMAGPSAKLSDFELQFDVTGVAIPAQTQSVALAMDMLAYDGAAQSATVSGARLKFAQQLIELSAKVSELDSAQNAQVEVLGADIDLARVAKSLQVELPAQASDWPKLSLNINADAALAQDKLTSNIKLGFGEINFSLDAVFKSIAKQTGTANLNLSALDLHAFLAQLGYPLKLKASPGPTALQAKLALAPDRIDIKPINGQLAGEALTGTVSISQFAQPIIRANLDLAGLTLSDWSGEEGKGSTSSSKQSQDEKSGDINEMEVPMEWARDLNLTARVALSRLNAYGVKLRDVRWTADARPGSPVKQQVVANAYGGEMAFNNSIDASQAEPVIGVNLSAKAIGLGDFLQDGWGSRWISGTTELGMDLTSRGATVGKMRSSANGDAHYRLKDGEMQGFSLVDLVSQASALASGGGAKSKSESTSFTELVGRFLLESGKLKVQDLGGDNAWFKFAGDGVIDLLAGQYNLSLAPILLENEATKNDKTLSKLVGLAIPIDVRGPLTAPKFKVNLEGVLKQKAKAEVDKEMDKQKDKLRNKLNDKLGDFLRSQ